MLPSDCKDKQTRASGVSFSACYNLMMLRVVSSWLCLVGIFYPWSEAMSSGISFSVAPGPEAGAEYPE